MLRPARTAVRWGVRHALPAVFLERGARRGDLIARLLRDPEVRDQPYAVHEQLRAQGPLVAGSLGLVTTSGTPVRRDLQTLRGFEELPVVLQ